MAIPHIREAQAPTLQNPARPTEVRFRNRVDWSKGGVYSKEKLKSFRDYMEFSRYKEVLGYQLTRQLRGGSVDLSHKIGYEGLDKWLRCQASVLEVHGSNPAMTWLKITSLLSLPYRR